MSWEGKFYSHLDYKGLHIQLASEPSVHEREKMFWVANVLVSLWIRNGTKYNLLPLWGSIAWLVPLDFEVAYVILYMTSTNVLSSLDTWLVEWLQYWELNLRGCWHVPQATVLVKFPTLALKLLSLPSPCIYSYAPTHVADFEFWVGCTQEKILQQVVSVMLTALHLENPRGWGRRILRSALTMFWLEYLTNKQTVYIQGVPCDDFVCIYLVNWDVHEVNEHIHHYSMVATGVYRHFRQQGSKAQQDAGGLFPKVPTCTAIPKCLTHAHIISHLINTATNHPPPRSFSFT